MSKPYVHKRRERIQPSFPNNRFSTRPRRRKVQRQKWAEEETTTYLRVADTAIHTPFDVPNPTDWAPTMHDGFSLFYFERAGGYAPALDDPLRACEWGDRCEPAQERKGGSNGPYHGACQGAPPPRFDTCLSSG